MKRRVGFLAVVLVGAVSWWWNRPPEPTTLVFALGQRFEDVAKNSSYPVMMRSNRPGDDPGGLGCGVTWVTEPAVIIRFSDPKHGFTLPTKFAALGYDKHVAVSLSTSPMLEKLTFDEAVAVLENLQNQFKAGGWEPWANNDSSWFDLSPEGKKRLYARMFEDGYYMQTTTLRIPKLYGMIFRLKCDEGCWTREPPYRFLIDIGL